MTDTGTPVTGKIIRVDLEGGFWGLLGDDGTKYYPIDLEDRFKEEGIRISASVAPASVLTTAQWGRTVHLRQARRIEA